MKVLLFGSELKDDIPKDLYEVNQSEYNVELAKERSEFGAFPVVGHCMEGAGIVDGGTVVVDFTRIRGHRDTRTRAAMAAMTAVSVRLTRTTIFR